MSPAPWSGFSIMDQHLGIIIAGAELLCEIKSSLQKGMVFLNLQRHLVLTGRTLAHSFSRPQTCTIQRTRVKTFKINELLSI